MDGAVGPGAGVEVGAAGGAAGEGARVDFFLQTNFERRSASRYYQECDESLKNGRF